MDPQHFQGSTSGRVVRAPTGYWAFVPEPLPPTVRWTGELVNALSDADQAIGELAGHGRSLSNAQLLIRPFVRREAVLSSRIEGTRASLSDLYAYEAGQLPLLESASDVREVHNYVRALEHGLTRLGTLPHSLRLIREMHALLMEGVRGEIQTPGEFRRSQNWIGPPGCTLETAVYVPPPIAEMRKALHAFEDYLHTPYTLPPLVGLGLIHYQIEAIHPFLDGNGRIGRLLIALLLCAWDLLPDPLLTLSAYFEAHRDDYYGLLLAVSQRGAWNDWLAFFLRAVAFQARDGVARSERLQDLRGRYREQLQTGRAAARLLRLVDLLFAQPVLTVRGVAVALDVEVSTAYRYVSQLEELGMLREITGRSRNRVFRADEVVRVVE